MLNRALNCLSAVLFVLLVAAYGRLVWEASHQAPQQTAQRRTSSYANEQVDPNVRIARYTGWLAGFTGLLGFVSFFQLYFLLRADRTARITANAARDSAEAASATARNMGDQARLARESIDLARQEFIATHRPKLRVRRFRPHLTASFPIAVSFMVVNVGESAAHLKEFEVTIGIQTRDNVAIEPLIQPMELRTLKAGESVLFVARAAELTFRDEMGITDNVPGPSFEFRGMIEYADDNGVIRRTGFWRVRDLQGRLGPKGESDYEYED